MAALMIVLTLVASETPYGIDWTAGVIRVPATKIGHLDGEWESVRPGDAHLADMLWELLKEVPVSGGKRVRELFASRKWFDEALAKTPGHVRGDTFELSLGGENGIIARIRHPEYFVRWSAIPTGSKAEGFWDRYESIASGEVVIEPPPPPRRESGKQEDGASASNRPKKTANEET